MIKNNDSERREYFRIDDEIALEFSCITQDEYAAAPELLKNLHNSSFSLSADFATLNNTTHPLLNNISQLHPDIAEYLQFLNDKIDSMSHLLLQQETSFDEANTTTANLSASGIMFVTEQTLKENNLLKMEIVLLPEKIGILVYGKVVSINDAQNKAYKVAVEFEHIRFEDQELMIKHNLNRQMADLREKNDNS